MSDTVALGIERLAARDDVARAEVLLYAYIDLNVIGGSSVWLASLASMLAQRRRVVLIAQRNITTDVVAAGIENRARVTILEPRDFDYRRTHFRLSEAIEILRRLDAACPDLAAIFIRGTDAASMLLSDHQFHARAYAYLTDFYEIGEDGVRVSAERARQLGVIASHARQILVQTERIAERIRGETGKDFLSLELPPPIPDDLPIQARRPVSRTAVGRRIRIGYAGKIAPNWGIRELLDWTEMLRADGFDVELMIIGSKIIGPTGSLDAFRVEIFRRMGEVGAIRHEQVTRAEALAWMRDMDFAWCWRPASLEQATLELSTKLVEGVASGFACICFPSEINRRLLGEDYPYFAETLEDLRRLLGKEAAAVPAATVAACRDRHSFATLAARLDAALPSADRRPAPRICFAGHDFRFIDPYISRLKIDGWPVTRDVWQWGGPEDLALSQARLAAADVVFCERGLANAVWYSRNLPPGKRLFVRIHLPEIGERGRPLAEQILPDAVERFIFVSERVRAEAVRLYGWPPEKTVVIPNFVLDDEYVLRERDFSGPIRLGMVGIAPWCKRIDRAIDLLEALQGAGHAAELHIKGPRPETIGFLHARGRREEPIGYEAQYDRLQWNPNLDRAVTFHPEGNDVAAFYRIVEHILSPGEIEGFHHALADGVLSGCHPVLWSWEGAAATYDPGWIVGSTEAAMDRILVFRRQSPAARSKAAARNRALVCSGYGKEPVFARLTDLLTKGAAPRKTRQSWRDRLLPRTGLIRGKRLQLEIASRTPEAAPRRQTSMISHNVPLHIASKFVLEYRKFQSKHKDEREPAVLCPCCGSSFAEWAPIRGEGRKTECPICRSYERHRHLWLTIHQDPTFFDQGSRLLHFAPEPFFREVFGSHSNIDYHDCDIAQSRATYQVDVTKIPFEDERFDRIICSHVLEHVPDDRKGMSELRRTLRTGGIAYILVPSEVREGTFEESWINTPELRLKHYRQATHVRIYSRDDFIKRLRDTGFDVTVQFPKRRFGESMCVEFGLGDNIYICRKN